MAPRSSLRAVLEALHETRVKLAQHKAIVDALPEPDESTGFGSPEAVRRTLGIPSIPMPQRAPVVVAQQPPDLWPTWYATLRTFGESKAHGDIVVRTEVEFGKVICANVEVLHRGRRPKRKRQNAT